MARNAKPADTAEPIADEIEVKEETVVEEKPKEPQRSSKKSKTVTLG